MPPNTDPDLLVGTNTADDAGVYRIAPDLALVQTLDFFTPILDDPYDFGRVAAANALSDVYAMGGRPLTALNILCFPAGIMDPGTAADILRGGADKVREAGALLVGGHTVQDREPKYGLSVTGVIHPERIVRNVGARPGDRLVLTKPLGTGVITTGLKRDEAPPEVVAAAAEGMATLNRAAADAMLEVGVSAATDITGFGLVGHLMEMLEGSGVSAWVAVREVPFYEGFWPLAERGLFPGGARDNLSFVRDRLIAPRNLPETRMLALCDPQTSGGLLIAVPAERHGRLVHELSSRGCLAATVGEVIASDGRASSIRVVF